MATNPSVAPTASFSTGLDSPEASAGGEFSSSLPDTVAVLPELSARETQVAYADVGEFSPASFAGSTPSSPAMAAAKPAMIAEPAVATVKADEPQVAGKQPAEAGAGEAGGEKAVADGKGGEPGSAEDRTAHATAEAAKPAEAPAKVQTASLPLSGVDVFPDPPPAPPGAQDDVELPGTRKTRPFQIPVVAGGGEEVNRLIEKYAALNNLPVEFVRRVVKRESNFRPSAFNRGHWGLMQIKHATARGMGYDGPAKGLLDAETNLKYAVKYLRGAWMVADGNPDLADRLYQSGYYYHAKRKGLLDETGLGRDRVRKRTGGAV